MKTRMLSLALVCSVALNLSFVGMCAYNMLNRPQASAPSECPFTSEYTHLYAALGLSSAQLGRIEPLARDFHEKAKIIGTQIVELRNKLVDAMAREDADMNALDAIHQSIALRQTAMQQLVVSHILEMKAVMIPDQRDRFFSAMRRSFQAQNFMAH